MDWDKKKVKVQIEVDSKKVGTFPNSQLADVLAAKDVGGPARGQFECLSGG